MTSRNFPANKPPNHSGDVSTWAGLSRHWLWFALLMFVLGMLLRHSLSGWLDRGGKPAISSSSTTAVSTQRRLLTGPWGRLEVIRIQIERPDEFIPSQIQPETSRWFFQDFSPAKLQELFSQVGLTEKQRTILLDSPNWMVRSNGIVVVPGSETVLSLSATARARLYSVLATNPVNLPQEWPFKIHHAGWDEWTRGTGLSTTTTALLRRLLYPRGDVWCFADLNDLLAVVPTDIERRRLVKMLSRQPTLLVKLHVQSGEDIEPLVAYWGKEGRAKDVRPLLSSLARDPQGGTLDISHLLTPFARMRLYTYPFPSEDPLVSRRDCAWTTMNFFSEEPEDRFYDFELTKRIIAKDYYPIQDDPAFGDVVWLLDAHDQPVHIAVHIAGGILFTKNGASFNQPWVLVEMADLLTDYDRGQVVRTVVYRRKRT